MKFVYHDAGRTKSKRPRQTNSCTVVALATATKISYDDAYDLLWEAGRTSGRGFFLFSWLKYKMVNGWKCGSVNAAGKNWTIHSFVDHHPKGVFIVKRKRHVYAVIDGVVYDHTKPTGDEPLISFVELTKMPIKIRKNIRDELKELKKLAKKKKTKATRKRKTTKHPGFEIHLCGDGSDENGKYHEGWGDPEQLYANTFNQAMKLIDEQIKKEPRRSLYLFKLDSSIKCWEERSWCYFNHSEEEQLCRYDGEQGQWDDRVMKNRVKEYYNLQQDESEGQRKPGKKFSDKQGEQE